MALHTLRILIGVVGGSFSARRTLPSRGLRSTQGTCHFCARCKPRFSSRKDVMSSWAQFLALARQDADLGLLSLHFHAA